MRARDDTAPVNFLLTVYVINWYNKLIMYMIERINKK